MPLEIKRTGLDQFTPGGKARVRLLVIAGGSQGKTRMASYYPSPIYADCEDGLASVADRNVPYVSINNSTDMLSFLAEMKLESAKPDHLRSYQTVVIDTIDAFQRKVKDEWTLKNPASITFTGRDAWNYLDAKIQLLLTRLLNLDMNIIVNAHFSTKAGENGEGKILGIQLDGSVKDRVFNDFGQVAWLDSEWVAEGGERVKKRWLTFEETPQRDFLKDRLHISPGKKGFPINFNERDYEQLFDSISARAAALKATESVGEIADYEDPTSTSSAAVVVPTDAGVGALPAQDPRDVPLVAFDRTTLANMAKAEGVQGIKGNWLKAEYISAIEAIRKEKSSEVIAVVATDVPERVVAIEEASEFISAVHDSAFDEPSIPEVVVPEGEWIVEDGQTVHTGTGEVKEVEHDEAVASIAEGLGATVISDDTEVDEPIPAPVTTVTTDEKCGDCGKSLKKEPENYQRLSFLKWKLKTCETCYLYRKNNGGQPKQD